MRGSSGKIQVSRLNPHRYCVHMLRFFSRHRLSAGVLAATILAGCAPMQPSPAGKEEALVPRARHPARPLARATNQLDVWMLNVGQGSCIYIACPDGASAILIDCGTSSIGATSGDAVTTWINDKMAAATTVTVLVTHGHIDHMSMLTPAGGIRSENVSRLMLGGQAADYSAAFMRWADSVPTKYGVFGPAEFKAADSRFQCGPAQLDLLTVNSTDVEDPAPFGSKKNADSAVVRLSYANRSVIIPGDAEAITERAAMANAAKNGLDLAGASMLAGSHHGANTYGSNGTDWLNAVGPHVGAFSAQVEFKHRHPRCATVERYGTVTDNLAASQDLACGNGAQPGSRSVVARLLSTHENGHILTRIGSQGTTYLCQNASAACDGTLEPEDLP